MKKQVIEIPKNTSLRDGPTTPLQKSKRDGSTSTDVKESTVKGALKAFKTIIKNFDPYAALRKP